MCERGLETGFVGEVGRLSVREVMGQEGCESGREDKLHERERCGTRERECGVEIVRVCER